MALLWIMFALGILTGLLLALVIGCLVSLWEVYHDIR